MGELIYTVPWAAVDIDIDIDIDIDKDADIEVYTYIYIYTHVYKSLRGARLSENNQKNQSNQGIYIYE